MWRHKSRTKRILSDWWWWWTYDRDGACQRRSGRARTGRKRGQVHGPWARRWSSDAAGVSHGPPVCPLASDGIDLPTGAPARTVPLYVRVLVSWRCRWPFDALKSRRPPRRAFRPGQMMRGRPSNLLCPGAEIREIRPLTRCVLRAAAVAWCRHACPRHRQACHLRACCCDQCLRVNASRRWQSQGLRIRRTFVLVRVQKRG
jgi:hypothetical protein